ncbi:MAG: FecR family protein [Sphingobacterium sp.]|jgi:ferric-dicitrate binding protein FerR (iron transport regulator)|nr:FecR family protein [Sphingobacterium sp.]
MSSEDSYFLELIQKYLDKRITATEEEELYHLMTLEESRLDLYLYLTQQNQSLKNRPITLDSLFESSKKKYKTTDSTASERKEKRNTLLSSKNYQRLLIAASVLIMISFGGFYLFQHILPGRIIKLTSAKGERKHFKLEDGTEIWLNSGSQLEYDVKYGLSNRDVTLSGEAYFKVTKNKKLPFHVNAYGNTIEVLGTQFNVQAYAEEQKMETTLFEGKVNLKVKDKGYVREFIMHPGEKIEVANSLATGMHIRKSNLVKESTEGGANFSQINHENTELSEALWTKNKLVFQDDPIDIMSRKIERWYNKTIRIENKNILNQSYTGVFQEKTAREVLDILIKTGANLHYKEQRDTIILY